MTEATMKLKRRDADNARAGVGQEIRVEGYKAAWCGENCTLDGRPARIVGKRHPFAMVSTIDPPFIDIEYSWATVARIMADGGKFKS